MRGCCASRGSTLIEGANTDSNSESSIIVANMVPRRVQIVSYDLDSKRIPSKSIADVRRRSCPQIQYSLDLHAQLSMSSQKEHFCC